MKTFAKRIVHLVVALAICPFLVGSLSAQESGRLPGEGMPVPPATATPKHEAKPPATKPSTPKSSVAIAPKQAPKLGPKLSVAPKQAAPSSKADGKAAQQQETAKKEPVKSPATTAAPAPAKSFSADTGGSKRDPFVSLVSVRHDMGGGPVLPPGKAGLVVATVLIDGTVRSGDGMIAMVSNPQKHVYFIREGDRLYDGDVEKISLDGVTFREESKDAFGKPVERTVTKRIYLSAGEQQ